LQEEERNAREQELERERAEHRQRMEEAEHKLRLDRQKETEEERLAVRRSANTSSKIFGLNF